MNTYTAKIFWQLLKTDLIQLRNAFKDNFINLFIWGVCTIFINVYIMQKMGLSNGYSDLIVGGIMVSGMSFQMFSHLFSNVSDFTGDQYIHYQFILPISNILIFIKSICAYTINGFIFGILGLSICKMMLFNTMNLTQINIFYLFISLLLSSLFFGTFTLFLSSIIKNPKLIGTAFSRIIFPLWFLGGFLFPWAVLYKTAPFVALINLLNPYVHMTESLRVATIGQKEFLPFWPSCIALILMAISLSIISIKKLKKRLDFI